MITRLTILLMIIAAAASLQAETRYISDSLEVWYRSGPTKQHRLIRRITSGEPVEFLQEDLENGASQIRLANGSEVWVDSVVLMSEKPVHLQLDELKKEYRQYRSTAEAQITTLRGDLLQARELAAASERLQKKIAQLELDNEGLELRNQTLSDRSRYDLLTAGGIVAVVGIFIGLILPNLVRRRRDDGWR